MPGYDALANFMCSREDASILRRFSQLNTESLLHMQAELLGLELTVAEIRNDSNLNAFNNSWLGAPQNDANAAIVNMFDRIRMLLDKYCKPFVLVQVTSAHSQMDGTILQTARINALDRPLTDSFDLLQAWYDSDEEKGGQSFLQGIEAAVFRDSSLRGKSDVHCCQQY